MASREFIVRMTGTVLIAAVLWGVVSLSGTFVVTMEVPLRVELPLNHALSAPIPPNLEVTVRARGWSLVKLLTVGRNECVIRPALSNGTGAEQRLMINGRTLLANIRMGDADAQQISVSPDSLSLAIGELSSKRVPVVPVVDIRTKAGFRVIGGLRVEPDSVTLIGTRLALSRISSWRTQTYAVVDAHAPVHRTLSFSDTLNGIIVSRQASVVVDADVQETAERTFTDVPVRSHPVSGDTTLKLVVQPALITITVRGGVRDLSLLQSADLVPWLELRSGADTLGRARPRIDLPANLQLLGIKPEVVRYLWVRRIGDREMAGK